MLLVVVLLSSLICFAQDEEGRRKITLQVKPSYPELARKMNVSGVVRMEVSVAPDGAVRDSKAIGGNPVLIQAAESAVKRWKFEPSLKPTVEIVTFRFNQE